MKIKLEHLKEGENELEYCEPPSQFNLPDENFKSPVNLSGIIDKRGKNYYFKISISVTGIFTCDRCLEAFEKQISSSIYIIYSKENYTQEIDKDNFYVISEDTNEVEIGSDVRDEILLNVPIKVLCVDDCKGICAGCGKDLNKEKCVCNGDKTDPRWESLKQLKFD